VFVCACGHVHTQLSLISGRRVASSPLPPPGYEDLRIIKSLVKDG
jgi:hypothetical protein